MDAFALPMDADPSRDRVVGYDEFGRPVLAGRLGTRYIQGAAPVQRNSLAGTPLSLADVMATSGGARGAGQPRQTSQVPPANAPEPSWGPLGGLANMLLEGLQAPGNALAGRPVTLGEVYGTAGVAAMGAAPMRAPENSLRMFAGRNAKTADLDAAARAEQLLQAGVSRDDVWRETGWMRGVDGQMRFEIDDSGMNLARGMPDEIKMKRGTLATGVKHPDMYAAYPDMQGMAFKPGYNMSGYEAMYEPASDAISINRVGKSWGDRAEFKGSTAHEAQHAIQTREGFAPGGNYTTSVEDEYAKMTEQLNEYISTGAYNDFNAWQNSPEGRRAGQGGYRKARLQYIADNPDDVDFQKASELETLRAGLHAQGAQDYRRLSGEVEARNVQSRINMTAAERRATPPWATQDVPDQEQIVRGR